MAKRRAAVAGFNFLPNVGPREHLCMCTSLAGLDVSGWSFLNPSCIIMIGLALLL